MREISVNRYMITSVRLGRCWVLGGQWNVADCN